MKKLIIALCTVGLLATSSFVRADDDDHKQGGATSGVENLQVDAVFIATSNAPAGAIGTLKMRGKIHHGTNDTQIKIITRGLADGTYTVSATLKSDGSTIALGQMTLGTGNVGDTNKVNPAVNDGPGNSANAHSAHGKKPKVTVSQSEFDLPPNVSAMDFAAVTISDSTDVPLLVADLVNAPGKSLVVFNARVAVVSDDPKVKGSAVLNIQAHNGKQRSHFVMVVQRLPKNTTLHVVVNGLDTGATVTTNRGGSVIVKKLAGVDSTNLQSVALTDDTGATLAQAVF